MKNIHKQKIVTVGGGSGSAGILSGLQNHDCEIFSIVGVFDDGGSTGRLRKEYNTIAFGDMRQCFASLSSNKNISEMLQFRFAEGELAGHTLGNILLTSFSLQFENMVQVLDISHNAFDVQHTVIPVSYDSPALCTRTEDGETIVGQTNVTQQSFNTHLESLFLEYVAQLNPRAKKALLEADKIIICPGDLFASITPHYLVEGFVEALSESSAQKIYICNPINKLDQTKNFTVQNFVSYTENYIGDNTIDTVIYNTECIIKDFEFSGKSVKDLLVKTGDLSCFGNINFVGEELLGEIYQQKEGDVIQRSPIRFDSKKLAQLIMDL